MMDGSAVKLMVAVPNGVGGLITELLVDGCMMDGWMDGWMDDLSMTSKLVDLSLDASNNKTDARDL